mmetsp:Transcript_72361/g.127554  ORF Transcript_72361/g.127554 Transcript_72361/m.127554 type:complete len:407 (-) Transcript_72361:822-2042(-)
MDYDEKQEAIEEAMSMFGLDPTMVDIPESSLSIPKPRPVNERQRKKQPTGVFDDDYWRKYEEKKADFSKYAPSEEAYEGSVPVDALGADPRNPTSEDSKRPLSVPLQKDAGISEEEMKLQKRCAQMSEEELQGYKALLTQDIGTWKSKFAEENGRDPTRNDVDAGSIKSSVMEYRIVSRALARKEAAQAAEMERQRQRQKLEAAREAQEQEDSSAEQREEVDDGMYIAPLTPGAQAQQAELQQLLQETYSTCQSMSTADLVAFKKQLGKKIMDIKRSLLTADPEQGSEEEPLELTSVYLQLSIVNDWIDKRTLERAALGPRDDEDAPRAKERQRAEAAIEAHCKRLTITQLEVEVKRLKQETDDFKEEFRKVHGRDPAIDDVYNLHMDSLFMEYAIVTTALEARRQ